MRLITKVFFAVVWTASLIIIPTSILMAQPTDENLNLETALKDFGQMNSGQKSEILSTMGVPQSNGFSLALIIAWVIFGGIGFVALAYGKKMQNFRALIIGIALMAYPYFIHQTLWTYVVGIALCLALYFWRE